MQKYTYYIQGMHCASCELLIEEKLLAIEGVRLADASLSKGELYIEYSQARPNVDSLNKIFSGSGYYFSDQPFFQYKSSDFWKPIIYALIVILAFVIISKLKIGSLVNINSNSSLIGFFIFGLLAGISSCAALVGGLILSLSKQWLNIYGRQENFKNKIKPHLLFNSGRLISYALLGALLGLIGGQIQISYTVSSILVVLVSALMLALALQMLGIQYFNRFQIALPKKFAREAIGPKENYKKNYPFLVGFMTFLLPCGFTLAAEGAAILSGNTWRGLFIMFFFALGTMLPLLMIGLSSVKLFENHKKSENFIKAAGLLVIFFVIYNLNYQFNLSGYIFEQGSSSTASQKASSQQNQNGQIQMIRAIYSEARDIIPSSFTVSVGQPVRFEIEVQDNGYGCMSTIMIPGLWNKPIRLIKNQTIVMEFTPSQIGPYQITCAMGVPRGTIYVK